MTKYSPRKIYLSHLKSPVGMLDVASIDKGLCLITFASAQGGEYALQWIDKHFEDYIIEENEKRNAQYQKELHEYFEGKKKRFYSKIYFIGTDFQLQVWTALRSIPYGETTSYKSIALTIGNPNATRAVGAAIGKNPVPIIVPCHRVIGENGNLVGFGGGIERKKKLLQLEGAIIC